MKLPPHYNNGSIFVSRESPRYLIRILALNSSFLGYLKDHYGGV